MSVPSYFSFEMVATLLVVAAAAAGWALALRDALSRPAWEFPPGPTRDTRSFWIAVLLLLNIAGAALYYVVVMRGRPRR